MGTALKLLLSFGFCLVVAACTTLETADIQQSYTQTVRKLGIVPVYPPREEFQIGDVFVASFGMKPGSRQVDINDSARVWVADFPEVADAADDFMGSRIVFRSGTTSKREDGDAAANTPDLFGRKLTRRKAVNIETLPISAFPSITADAGFTAGLGISQALQSLGIGGGDRTLVRLDFNDVRTYWVEPVKLDQVDIRNRLLTGTIIPKQLGPTNPIYTSLKDRERIEELAGRDISKTRCTAAVVVTRVYLTRQINFTYYNAAIIAAGLRRAEEGQTAPAAPVPSRITVNVNQATGEAKVAGSTDDELTDLQTKIDSFSTGDTQGTSLNFQSWNALGITFSKTYDRPVAIGYEGFSFPVDIGKNATQKGYPRCS
ncbi:hypothetical protein [Cucumibacter marinus]|uniref:hypothetical protein n=1 Tax=Cucumibacter marinus TaxID=1121252 RepID=UPI000419CAFB|nr:hypothetical protein [Cucumibacter marinus]